MTRYKLLKDLPGVKAGAIFTAIENETGKYTTKIFGRELKYSLGYLAEHPDWFQPIPEGQSTNPEIIGQRIDLEPDSGERYKGYVVRKKSWSNKGIRIVSIELMIRDTDNCTWFTKLIPDNDYWILVSKPEKDFKIPAAKKFFPLEGGADIYPVQSDNVITEYHGMPQPFKDPIQNDPLEVRVNWGGEAGEW